MRKHNKWRLAVAILACAAIAFTACSSGSAQQATSSNAEVPFVQPESFVKPGSTSGCPSPACSDILAQVESGAKTDTIPPDLTPSLADAVRDLRYPDGCQASRLPISWLTDQKTCIFDTGAPANAPMIILIGDSQARMWSTTVNSIAKQNAYRFGLVNNDGCHMPITSHEIAQGQTVEQCREWKHAAIDWLNQQDPAVVLVASAFHYGSGMKDAEAAAAYAAVLKQMQGPGRKLFLMGDVPQLTQDPPRCLAAHPSSALKCATEIATAAPANEQQAALTGAQQAGAGYVNLTPWLCTTDLCPAIVGHYAAYQDQWHITTTYAQALMPLVQKVIGL
jgi:hypothetical protein